MEKVIYNIYTPTSNAFIASPLTDNSQATKMTSMSIWNPTAENGRFTVRLYGFKSTNAASTLACSLAGSVDNANFFTLATVTALSSAGTVSKFVTGLTPYLRFQYLSKNRVDNVLALIELNAEVDF